MYKTSESEKRKKTSSQMSTSEKWEKVPYLMTNKFLNYSFTFIPVNTDEVIKLMKHSDIAVVFFLKQYNGKFTNAAYATNHWHHTNNDTCIHLCYIENCYNNHSTLQKSALQCCQAFVSRNYVQDQEILQILQH